VTHKGDPPVIPTEPPQQLVRHKIGSARTIQTAVLVCEYLRCALGQPQSEVHPDQIRYHFYDPTDENGFWTADIIVEANQLSLEDSHRFVDICRAFVAGRGEIWI
jgi:hypothetical protein